MEQYKIYEFPECVMNDKSPKPQIQILDVAKNDIRQENLMSHVISIFMEGSICVTLPDNSKYMPHKGQMFFVPAGSVYSWTALEDSQFLLYRLLDPGIRLCDNFPAERLHYDNTKHSDLKQIWENEPEWFSVLDIHPRLWQRLECTRNSIKDGIRCRKYFEMEVELLFLMLRLYYHNGELNKFLRFVITGNTVFTEFVRLRWRSCHTVNELANSMHLTPKYFTRKFKQYFNQNPHQWMANNRARIIFGELTSTTKPLKLIASENGFSTFQQFAVFTKKMLGKTPTEIRTGKVQQPE
jgi:AraC-like DNA-binding protein